MAQRRGQPGQGPSEKQFALRVFCGSCNQWLLFPVGAHTVICSVCNNTINVNPHNPKFKGRCHHVLNCCSTGGSKSVNLAIFVFTCSLTFCIVGGGFTYVLPALIQPTSFSGVLAWGFSIWLTFNVAYNFFVAGLSDPGAPPPFVPEDRPVLEDAPTRTWCVPCNNLKPAGTHHCKTCKRCIANMDHHCVFINNCVGERNYRFFLLYVFWVAVSTLYVAILCLIAAATLDLSTFPELPLFEFFPGFTSIMTLQPLRHKLMEMSPALMALKHLQVLPESLFRINAVSVLLVASLATSGLVTAMLHFHLGLIAREETTLESFKSDDEGSQRTPSRGLVPNLRDLMGGGRWWILHMLLPKHPRWINPYIPASKRDL